MFPSPITKFVEEFSKLPGIGPKQSLRLAFYLAKKQEGLDDLKTSLEELKNNLGFCKNCFRVIEKTTHSTSSGQENPDLVCEICKDPKRNKNQICVVEDDIDLENIEKSGSYQGAYHVLGETVDLLNKEEKERPEIKLLEKKVKELPLDGEVIIATNPTSEGEATFLFLKRIISPYKIKITRLGRGLPTGAELEYADEETIKGALEGRK